MLLIPRFYFIVDKNNFSFIMDRTKNKKRYFTNKLQKSQRFFMYYDDNYTGKFININNTFYYRPDHDVSKDFIFNNICINCGITDPNGHVMFQRHTRNLNKIYPYNQDLYQLFYSFSQFESWMNEDYTKLIWKILPYKKYNIDEYKDIFISYIHNHFEKNAGNIFLLKVKFRNDNTIL